MIQVSYANFFSNTSSQFVSKDLARKIDMKIKHSSGIYKITNVITNECYIGQSEDCYNRMRQHKIWLKEGKHQNILLQNAWNTYGASNFKFEIIDWCNKDELDDRECFWIKHCNCNYEKSKFGYNSTDGGKTGHNKNKGRILINNGIEQKKVFKYEIDYYLANGFQIGMLQKEKDALKNRDYSKKYKPVVQLLKDGNFVDEFDSVNQGAEKVGVAANSISACCHNRRKTAGGYMWMFKEDYVSLL